MVSVKPVMRSPEAMLTLVSQAFDSTAEAVKLLRAMQMHQLIHSLTTLSEAVKWD